MSSRARDSAGARSAEHVLLALCGMLAAILTLLAVSRHGVGLSPDSAYYLSAAENLARGRGLVCFDGSPLVAWPPLYSTLLALPAFLGIAPLASAPVINAVAFGATVYLSGLVLLRVLRHRPLAILASFSLAVSLPMLATAVMAWTEAVFGLLVVGFVLLLARFLSRPRAGALAAACFVGTLLPLQRYIGGILVVAGAALIFVTLPGRRSGRRLGYAVLLASVSLTPLLAWAARNQLVAGSPTGQRMLAPAHIPANIGAFYGLVAELLVPRGLVFPFAWCVTLLLALGTSVFILWTRGRAPEPRGTTGTTVVATLLFYAAAVVLVLTPEAYDQVGRLLAPVYGLVITLVLVALERLSSLVGPTSRRRRWATWGLLAGFAVWNVLPVSRTLAAFSDWSRNGVGVYDTLEWRTSPLIAWLEANPLPGTIHSNDPAAIYLLARQPARMSPRRNAPPDSAAISPGDHLVWFRRVNRPYLLTVQELSARWPLREIVFTGDGGVLAVEPTGLLRD